LDTVADDVRATVGQLPALGGSLTAAEEPADVAGELE
jgi:hypothetical protein